MTNYFQRCISCDDPIDVNGFELHVCEQCRREVDGSGRTRKQLIACRLYQVESADNSRSMDSR